MFGRDIGIDLGTSSVLIYVKGQGIVLREPSVVALDRSTGELLEVGAEAQKMLGRTPGGIVALRPLREGVISDYEMTRRMLRAFLSRVPGSKLFRPNLVICIPASITEVEERAVVDAGMHAGAKRVYLIAEPMAAALGAGLDIDRPQGNMVIDIGGGTTDIAVLSMGTVVESDSVKIAGDKYDEAIMKYLRRKYNLLIGERTAEEIKINIGCVYPRPDEKTMEVRGRCLLTGLPRSITLSSSETMEATEEVTSAILDAIHGVLERTSPELVADIAQTGAMLTGGGCLIWGFDRMLAERTGLPAHIADDAVSCVVYGTGKALENLANMRDGTMNLSRRCRLDEPSDYE